MTGIIMHGCFTGRLALVSAWLIGFVLQALGRAWYFDVPLYVPLTPMTSAAFILFTLYMIPDPATTPLKPGWQAMFGFAVAMVYGGIQVLHLVFGLFFALVTVCAIRGLSLHIYHAFKTPGPAGTEKASATPAIAPTGNPVAQIQ